MRDGYDENVAVGADQSLGRMLDTASVGLFVIWAVVTLVALALMLIRRDVSDGLVLLAIACVVAALAFADMAVVGVLMAQRPAAVPGAIARSARMTSRPRVYGFASAWAGAVTALLLLYVASLFLSWRVESGAAILASGFGWLILLVVVGIIGWGPFLLHRLRERDTRGTGMRPRY